MNHLKGHHSLAEMVSTHIGIWRGLLEVQHDFASDYVNTEHGAEPTGDKPFWAHEIMALEDIKAACDAEMSAQQRGDFGHALNLLKAGKRVARSGWNGKGMWLRHVDPYLDREFKVTEAPDARGTLAPWIGMKTADNKFVPWLASQTDVLATDWAEVPA